MDKKNILDRRELVGARQLAKFISVQKTQLIDQWLTQIRGQILAARNIPVDLLVNSLPNYLEQVICLLHAGGEGDRSGCLKIAKEHGATRVALSYGVRDVAAEYTALHEILFEWPGNGVLEPGLVRFLNRLSDAASIEAVEEFLEVQRYQPERDARLQAEADEAYVRDLIDTSPATLWITDENSRCTYLSRQWYEFTGRTPDQDLGMGWLENIHPDDLAETARVYTNAVKDRGVLRVDYRLRGKNGDYRWSMDIGYPRFNRDGEFRGYIGTVTDIDDRVTIAQTLRDSQERFDRSTRATDLGIWYCDLPFDKLNWNREVKNHFFLPADAEITIDLFYERIHPEDRELTRRAIAHSIARHAPYDVVYRTTKPGDPSQIKFIRALGWTDYNALGEPIRFDGITLDESARIEAQRQLREAMLKAERANETKSAFLANMSHEIRTPLGAILGFSDLARQPGTPFADVQNYLSIVERNSTQVLRIIDDILDLSKVEAGHMDLEHVEFSLVELLADFSSLMGFRARNNGIVFKVVADSNLPKTIVSDPTRLRQILTNAVGNAIKFTDRGSVALHVRATDGSLVFSVIDTGHGISPQQSKILFQPFVQADVSTTRQFGGTGLGLVLTRRLCRLMGGDYVLERSEPGKGSVFVATVEVAVPEKGEMMAQRDIAFRSDGAKPAEAAGKNLNGVNTLLVEDSLDNQQLISLILARLGAKIEIASDGAIGVERALSGSFDVVLMDIQMPVMDGYQAIQLLRSRGYATPVIALTAHAMKEEIERAVASGFNGYLTKPIQRNALIEMILDLARPR